MIEIGKKRRNDLSLKLKYEVLKVNEKEPKIGCRKLASMFKCGKTQIQTILQNKDRIKDLYESNQKINWAKSLLVIYIASQQ